jgi:hypothetical protein
LAARTVVCPECSETLPYGRLSCPACGSLLAAVTGGRARAVPPPVAPAVVMPDLEPPAQAAEEAVAPQPRRRWRAKQNDASAEQTESLVAAGPAPGPVRTHAASPAAASRRSALAPSKVGAVTLAARLEGAPLPMASTPPASTPPAAAATPPAAPPTPAVLGDWVLSETQALGGPSPWRRDGVQRPRDEDFENEVDGPLGAPHAGGGNGNSADRRGTRLPTWAGGPAGSAAPVDWPAAPAPVASDGAKPAAPPPGAYLPPSGAFSARDSGLPRGQLVQPGSARVATAPAPRPAAPVASPVVPVARQPSQPRPGGASLFADLPFDTPKSLPGWLIAAGSAAAIAGFLLPWSRMIPGQGGFGYLDTWGLASPSRVLLLLFTVVALALAILPNRAPAWLRTGVAGLVLGGLLLGIVWPYVLDGASAIGTLAEAAAALLLIIGGLLAVRPQRHAEDDPAV